MSTLLCFVIFSLISANISQDVGFNRAANWANRISKPRVFGFGIGMGIGYGAGSNTVDQYLTVKLANFSHWMSTKAATKNGGTDIDALPIANVSDVVIRNRFYDLDLSFTNTRLDGYATKVRPGCVRVDLEGGKISVGYYAYNITLSGNFTGNGTILNGTTFNGEGGWISGLQLSCTLDTYFNYGNMSHFHLEESREGVPDSKNFRFYCGSARNMDESSRESSYLSRRMSNGCSYYSRSEPIYSKFDGLFNSTTGTKMEELEGAQFLIENSLARHVHNYGREYVDVIRTQVGPLLYQQLRDVMQEKSVFEMLNFDLHEYYQKHAPSLVYMAF